jgi:hypothetical protein
MGLGRRNSPDASLAFRDRANFGWPVELRVSVTQISEGADFSLFASSFGNRNAAQRQYVSALMRVFIERMNQALTRPTTVQDGWPERGHRLALGCLKVLGWVPLLLYIAAFLAGWPKTLSGSALRGWALFVLVLSISQGSLALRRRLVGTSLRWDPLVIAACCVLTLAAVILVATIG